MLLFGRDRLARFPDAWIQAGRFAGIDRSAMADRAELREYPINAIEGAVSIVERNTRLGAEIGRLRRRDVPAVPPVALREALVNAVVHADYTQRGAPIRVAVFDDRVEIENPGILLPGLTPEDLHEGISRLRNPVIGRIFKELGLIEQWGSGIQRMSAANRSAGLPEPEFTELGLRFRVTLRTTATGTPQVDDTERRILEFLDAPNGRSTAELATHIERTARTTQQRLKRLAERGLVVAVGTSPRDPRRRWYLSTPGMRSDSGEPAS
jgi:predicted HTH transcriptional regulator